MPPIIPPRKEQAAQALAQGARGVRAAASQQQVNIATASGLVAYSTGILYQQGSSTNYTTGYGWEVPSNGAGSFPIVRAGVLEWVSPSGGTQTVVGWAKFDSNGLLRVLASAAGMQVFNTSGTGVGYVPYFDSGGLYVGNINF